MSGRGEVGAPRRAPRAPRLALVLVLLLALLVPAAVTASGCGGAADAEMGAYLGAWERVVEGTPDPGHTLLVERSGDGATLSFADASGFQAQGAASLHDGYLAMEMPADNGIFDGATSLQVSLDAGSQLVVDKVLDDGTTEPVWVYERAASAAPGTEP